MGEKKPTSGRKFDQKMKPYLVMQYLIQNTDESHVITATDLADKSEEKYDIDAERRSIYSDIHAINLSFRHVSFCFSYKHLERRRKRS